MPTVHEMREQPAPQFPPSGCKACDGMRKHWNNSNLWCLRHDPSISAEERKRLGVAYETMNELFERMNHAKTQ